ncbi:DNA-directed RNA polymerase subunit B [Kaumoebavirus]|uniref:DNA-directed RNA polymerase subunit B n=1 Tax=Kaumoebavirus TaxID=1859492 RepID=UPI0009C21F3A|nr:DNA-directed RNA polymerase subunit B [Kaumoebavirus]ARA72182.1 DNA-directed RNA polymerase subunit B [Kaumoebavirus]
MASTLNCNQLTQAELNVIPDKELETRGEIEHHLSSFNEFASTGLMQIMTEIFTISRSFINERNKTPEDREIETINFEVKITNVKVNKPTYNLYNSGKTMPLMPNLARRDLKTYSAGIYVDAKIEAKAYKKNQAEPVVRRDTVKNFRIASLPTMVRSELCNTHKLPKQALKMFEEDPTDLGGYFIIKGTEWAIDSIESRVYNYFHCFKNVGFRNELARGEYISKPGDAYENSAEFKIIYQDNGGIVIDITNPYFENMSFPFHVIFRLLGFTSDKEIFDNIVMSYGSAVSDHMIDVLKGAAKKGHSSLPKIEDIRDQASILAYLAERLNVGAVPKDNKGNPKVLKTDEKQYYNNLILNVFDLHFLTHMGTKPEDRRKKLRLLGQLIHRLLLVEMGILESTNRDSLATKRMAPAGRSYAKVFKTQFNLAIVQAIRKRLSRDFKYTSFSQVNLAQSFMSAINGPDLERALVQAIVNGDKIMMIKNKPITNRLSSQLLNRKNPLNVVSALRNIRTPNTSSSKQDARADEMRRVQPTYPGFIDISQSADTGEMVGLAKQMPISTSIANTGVSAELKLKLLEDPDIKKLDDVTNEELASGWSKIFVNGEWIGATRYSWRFVEKYRNYRRNYADNLIISPYTTIHYDTNTDDINFWVDAGRLMRPLIIVKNNYEEIKDKGLDEEGLKKEFHQDILVTKRHIQALIADKLTVEDLLSQGVIEYLAPEEQQNMLIAQDLNELRKNVNNPLVRYTHCECPIALFGLPSLLCPLLQHNQAPRVAFETNQGKQTYGYYALNWPYRIDKNAYMQYCNEMPILRTLTAKYTSPNGCNLIVAVVVSDGNTQEDSGQVNKTATENGLFAGCHFNFVKTELEKGEEFSPPDFTKTTNIKTFADYSKLDGSLVRAGTVLYENDVIVCKRQIIAKPTDKFIYADKSIIYKYREPAVVEYAFISKDADDVEFAIIKFKSHRDFGIGNKFCLTDEHEVLCLDGWKNISEVTTEDRVASLVDDEKIEYVNPIRTYEFNHKGKMWHVENSYINLTTTMKHKHYVKVKGDDSYGLVEAKDLVGRFAQFKKDGLYDTPEIETFTLYNNFDEETNPELAEIPDMEVPMDAWLRMLGIFISDGCLDNSDGRRHCISIAGAKWRKIININQIGEELGFVVHNNFKSVPEGFTSTLGYMCHNRIYSPLLYKELEPLNVGALNKRLPEYVWKLNQRQSRVLLEGLIAGDGCKRSTKGGTDVYTTSSKTLADDVQRLIFHCGWSGSIHKVKEAGSEYDFGDHSGTRNADCYQITVNKHYLKATINNVMKRKDGSSNRADSVIENFNGKVYCLEVPSHIFYVRSTLGTKQAAWTGNSSRAGMKGMLGITYVDYKMPFTESGIIPDLIINPSGFPTRLTVNQIIESHLAKLAGDKGVCTEGTAFTNTDFKATAAELEKRGFEPWGYERLYNGVNGEWMDAMVYQGVVYYQRLQKDVQDELYAVSTAQTCIMTRQPVEGKNKGGGLRMGEMERDCTASNGMMRMYIDKCREESDGYDINVCQNCNKLAAVNNKHGIFKCKNCGDNAVIYTVRSAYASKLFVQELESTNVGVKLKLAPFEFEEHQ